MEEQYNIKEILIQYEDLVKERESLKESISQIEKRISKMEQEGYTVIDSVLGGNGGKQHFKIEGFPYSEYDNQMALLMLRKSQQEDVLEKIEQQIALAEHYIYQIKSSTMRRMITYRYINKYSWIKVAHSMGKHYTADGCRMAVERFLKEK